MKTALFFIPLMFLCLFVHTQEIEKNELKEYFLDAEFFFVQEEYTDALYEYLELYNNGYQDVANINYRIGICYLNIPGQKDKAIPHLVEAVRDISSRYRESSFKQESAPPDAWLFLGNAYRVNNMLDEAIDAYNKFKELTNSDNELQFADQQITACNTALRYISQPLDLRIVNLGDSINSISSNYKAVVSGDGRVMAYMTELPFYNAVYFSRYRNGSWSAPINITPQIQSDGDQYVSSISYDGTVLYLTKEDAFNSDIYTSNYVGDRWTKSEPVRGNEINTKYWESHASISSDSKKLYFASNRRNGLGNMDIYVSELMENGVWGEPLNMGSAINTALNEDTPFITENDSMLYFSSQGHENIGGYDIFRTSLNHDGSWSSPQNIGYPVNTTDDDLFYYPWHNARIGYMSLYRDDSFGKEDVYAFQSADDRQLHELIADLLPKEPESEVLEMAEAVVKDTVESIEPLEEKETTAERPVEVKEEAAERTAIIETPELPVEKIKEIELSPVYFNFDEHTLTETGKNKLREVYDLLSGYPEMHIRLVGHADAIGTTEYNLELSEKRAMAALNYLVGLGIDAEKLTPLGLGETSFAAINSNPDGTDNPEGRRLNRRVEFEIIVPEDSSIIITAPAIPENLRHKE